MRRAVLIGINYTGTPAQLNGCINDVQNIGYFLKTSRQYTDIQIVSDETNQKPTRQVILGLMQQIFTGTRVGDELWFHYSGHGTLVRDTNGDEQSGKDSAICPIDYEKNGVITDDEIRKELVDRCPTGVSIYIVLDCCHSGSGCDLRYLYTDTSNYIGKTAKPAKYDFREWSLAQSVSENKKHAKSAGNVYMISGCQDEQTSADGVEEGKSTGALTYCLLKVLRNNFGNLKWKHLLKDTRCLLKIKGYTQVPQLSGGRAINMEQPVFPGNYYLQC